jgi:hypothetical protein
LTAVEIADDRWLHGALEHRKLLVPKKRTPKTTKAKKPSRRGKRSMRCDTPELPIPDSPELLPMAPAGLPAPTPLGPQPLTRSSPVFVRSPSERSELFFSDSSSEPSTITLISQSVDFQHRNASPPTPPPDTSMESTGSFSSDEELMNFNPQDHSREVRRRREAGLPSPRTYAYVDIPATFFLVS